MQAYFLRTIHTDPNKWTDLIIITNNWHMDRVKAIFSTIFSLPRFYSHDNVINEVYKLQFVAVDALITPEILQLRQEREKKSLLQFVDKTAPMFHTLQDVHNFLFLNHKAYSVERLSDGYVSERIDPELLKSY